MAPMTGKTRMMMIHAAILPPDLVCRFRMMSMIAHAHIATTAIARIGQIQVMSCSFSRVKPAWQRSAAHSSPQKDDSAPDHPDRMMKPLGGPAQTGFPECQEDPC